MGSYKVSRRKSSSFLKISGIVISLIVIVSVIAGFVVWGRFQDALQPVSTEETEIIVTITEGSSARQIATILYDKDLLRADWAFYWYSYINRISDYRAGIYNLSPSLSVQEIAQELREGNVATDLVTILPGQTINQIRNELLNEGFELQDVDNALNVRNYQDHSVFEGQPLPVSLEGYLYPESFIVASGTTAETIIRLSLDEMSTALSADIRQGIINQGLSVYQGVILASIVEREVSDRNAGDRPQVAQVFLSRLEIGMRLQSNATDPFPAEYNTYSIEGLPPSPISNVTISSLRAVANPAPTEYLYFVSGSDCTTRFSPSVEQHDALKARFGIARPEDNCR